MALRNVRFGLGLAAMVLGLSGSARAQVQLYGDENVLNSGTTYASDPTAGASLVGLTAGQMTAATLITPHAFPFSPEPGDFAGTDQIYVGSVQTGAHDGYSVSPQRINGPDVMTLDYSALLPAASTVQTLTLGIALDDFQPAAFGNPFTVSVNGHVDSPVTNFVNTLNETGPSVQFFTFGLPASELTSSHSMVSSIDEGGDGGDGYAIDFLTVGVTHSTAAPEPGTLALVALAATAGFLPRRNRPGTGRKSKTGAVGFQRRE